MVRGGSSRDAYSVQCGVGVVSFVGMMVVGDSWCVWCTHTLALLIWGVCVPRNPRAATRPSPGGTRVG
jgi:hypothetical protein